MRVIVEDTPALRLKVLVADVDIKLNGRKNLSNLRFEKITATRYELSNLS